MADNVKVEEGKGPAVATDDVDGVHVQRVKVQHGADGSATDVSAASPLPVSDAGGSLTVDSPALGEAADVEATGNGSLIGLLKRLRSLLAGGLPSALTGSGNLKVAVQETTLAAPLPVRLSDGSEGIGITAKRLHVDDGGSSLSVDDNGGSLTVDGTVAVGSALPAGNNNIGDVDVATLPALPAGTNAIGKLAANSGVDIGDVDVTSIAAGNNAIGNVGLIPRTSGGLSIFRSLDLDETEEQVKGTAGQVYGYFFANRATGWRYLKFYNATEASVTVGTTTPVMTLPLPPESSGHVPFPQGLAFSTAITVATTNAIGDSDTTAPSNNDVVLNLFYA